MRYIIFILSLLPIFASAQTKEYPFVEEGKVWVTQLGGFDNFKDPYNISTTYYSMRGDTIIAGRVAKKFFCDSAKYMDKTSLIKDSYVGAFYEEDNKLYFCDEDIDIFQMIFDCNVNAGDSTDLSGGAAIRSEIPPLPKVVIESIKPFKENTTRREFFIQEENLHFVNDSSHTEVYIGGSWIEGIGRDTFFPLITWVEVLNGGAIGRLVACYVGNRVDYLLTGISTPTIEDKPAKDAYYSIDGRRLTAPPARGVYIHNGRKIIR